MKTKYIVASSMFTLLLLFKSENAQLKSEKELNANTVTILKGNALKSERYLGINFSKID